MFIEGSPEFRHSLLCTAVFRSNKFLTAQRTLVDELLANFPRLYQKLRFFHHFVLHCKSPPAHPIRMARGGGVEGPHRAVAQSRNLLPAEATPRGPRWLREYPLAHSKVSRCFPSAAPIVLR